LTERYSDALRLIILYPKIISLHFEGTSSVFSYNIEHKWDWDLDKLISMPKKQWLFDLIYISKSGFVSEKLKNLMKTKILKKYNIDLVKERKNINKYIVY
jgi:hypothetical protein